METPPPEQWKALRRWFGSCPFALVAYSGGVDSTLVAFLASRLLGPARSLAVISDSPSLKRSELREARKFCVDHGVPLVEIRTGELDDPRYTANPANRCFYCKQTLYRELQPLTAAHPGSWVLNGTNRDDLGDYRPGLQAASDFRVRSPLAECGLDKASVRGLAAGLGLACWDKPASPCLSSRIAYGLEVTPEKLRQVEAGEALLQEAGFAVVRVRHFGELARIEAPLEDLPRLEQAFPDLLPRLQALGFAEVVLDPEGFVSGKLNRSLLPGSAELPIL